MSGRISQLQEVENFNTTEWFEVIQQIDGEAEVQIQYLH